MFCIVPGKVKSKTDGDIHYIGVAQLVQLYNLSPGQWIRHRQDNSCRELIHLSPRYDGDYFDANERYRSEA